MISIPTGLEIPWAAIVIVLSNCFSPDLRLLLLELAFTSSKIFTPVGVLNTPSNSRYLTSYRLLRLNYSQRSIRKLVGKYCRASSWRTLSSTSLVSS